jgi:hypothetical protein
VNKNSIAFVDRNLGRLEIDQVVRNSIENFVSSCLNSDYDVIVPIQEEGLAIFLPQLKERKQVTPEIIPSNSLIHIEKEKLLGKRILVVEAAVRTGGEITEITEYIEKNFQIKSTSIAAFLVLDGFKYINDLEIPIYHVLSSNQYLWAKEVVTEYLLDEVFVHFADPPMWEVGIAPDSRQEFIRVLIESNYAYIVPELNKGDDWIRITIDGIILNDRDWLIPEIKLQDIHKIRILLHKRKDIVRILPLFYPKILATSKLLVKDVLDFAKQESIFNTASFNKVHQLSAEVKLSPYNTFRWTSTLGSILLLRDMQFLIPELKINFNELKLSAPIPNLYQYSCSETTLIACQSLARDVVKPQTTEDKQLSFPKTFFKFINKQKFDTTLDTTIQSSSDKRAPEEMLVHAFSKWINGVYSDNSPNLIDTLNKGLPIEDILVGNPNIFDFSLDQALDRLIDEGLLKPRLGYDKNNYVVRTFAPGGESIRIYLRSLGRMLESISGG